MKRAKTLDLGSLRIVLCRLPPKGKKVQAGRFVISGGLATIYIDLSCDANPAATLIHELVHILDTKLREQEVLALEKSCWQAMNQDMQMTLMSLFNALPWRDKPLAERSAVSRAKSKGRTTKESKKSPGR